MRKQKKVATHVCPNCKLVWMLGFDGLRPMNLIDWGHLKAADRREIQKQQGRKPFHA